ncbi:hypothetical protein TU86_21195 [Pseudomonas weihenstephanensis]|uniref:Uncharacterized protein n=1 Tax=Pseudomonas weihenstephanensis TaxID=1608994 RepID=A0A0J6IIB4_9PSED|nr:hypothetical protein TU86_21195 [Pseudomonas weihenstephanensis]
MAEIKTRATVFTVFMYSLLRCALSHVAAVEGLYDGFAAARSFRQRRRGCGFATQAGSGYLAG